MCTRLLLILHVWSQVTIQVEYWPSNDVSDTNRCPNIAVQAEEQELKFYDESIDASYVMRLVVYENGLENTYLTPIFIEPTEDPPNTSCKYIDRTPWLFLN